MAKAGMKRPEPEQKNANRDKGHGGSGYPKGTLPVPELQGKAKSGKQHAQEK